MSSASLTDAGYGLRWFGARWRSTFFAGSTARELGFYRLLFYGFVVGVVAAPSGDVTRWADVSDVFWGPTSVFRFLQLPVLSAGGLVAMLWIWRLALVLAVVGLFTRLSTAVAAVLGFYLLGLPHGFGKVHHHDAIVVIGLIVFACARSGDAWSLDALRRERLPTGHQESLSGDYSWPVEVYRLMLALVLFSAGVAKLLSPGPVAWTLSDNLYYLLLAHHYTHVPPTTIGLLVIQYPWLCQVLAGATLVLELAAPVLVLCRGPMRMLFTAGVVAMLLGFWLMMGVRFVELILLFAMFFFPWRDVGARPMARSTVPRLAVLYDGSCGLCNRTIATVRALDLFRRVEMYDVLADWPRVSTRWPTLDQAACLEDMHVIVDDGRVFTGFYGYRALASHLPLAWLFLPFLYLPGIPAAGVRVYSLVARRRHASGCRLPEVTPPVSPP